MFNLPGFFLDFSWPSCPRSLHPHVYTVPSSRTNTVCLSPHPTSRTFLFTKKSLFLGSSTISSSIPPRPSCPYDAFPQHNMLVRTLVFQLRYTSLFGNTGNLEVPDVWGDKVNRTSKEAGCITALSSVLSYDEDRNC